MAPVTETGGDTATVAGLVVEATTALAAAVGSPRLDAEVLLAAACGLDRTALYLRGPTPVPGRCRDRFHTLVARRLAREPLQYLVGMQEFWSLDFVVTPDALIPRPETELLVEITLSLLGCDKSPAARACSAPARPQRAVRLCDLGTGSGCVAVALARERPDAVIWAVDISPAALAVAKLNARQHAVADRLRFVASDLCTALRGQCFDAIISNPPYVSTGELRQAQPELRYEPRVALDGGRAGLDVIRRILTAAPGHLAEGGYLVMEIGAAQADAVQALACAAGFATVSVRSDYAGLPRVLLARR
ncbi:MAG: peptide chain release factor N(5)-glutamine methyltransferase [Candidatus Binatia bacterium]